MKYLSLLPLAGLAVAVPAWSDGPAAASWSDDDSAVTVTSTAQATYCPKTGKITKPAPDNDVAKCTISVTKVTVTEATATVTVTAGGKPGGPGAPGTVTVTKDCPSPPTDKPSPPGGKCLLTKEKAETIVNNFRDLLEYTSFVPSASRPGAPGRGYHMDVSNKTLAPDFVDISDSINFMAGFKLGSVTFPNKAAFDYGQGVQQPEVLTETLNIFTECNSIVWRWKITPKVQAPAVAYPVVGINYMIINDKGLIQKNYAEFDNAAWISSFGPQAKCGQNNITVVDGEFAKKM